MKNVFAIPISDPGRAEKFIIYRPLAGLAFVGNRAMAELAQTLVDGGDIPVSNSDNGALAFLENIGFLEAYKTPIQETDNSFQPATAVLLTTNQCQLRCIYCYASAGELPEEKLAPELGYAAIDHVCQNAQELGLSHFDVSFHGGGEPTFAWELLKSCTTYARQKPLKAVISLTSNGIWSQRQREWIIASLDNVSLSVDGAPETQDRQRPFSSGRGSAGIVVKSIAELDRHGFPYGIRLTATIPWDSLPTDVQYLCRETGCRTMQVEPAFNTGRGGHGQADETECLAFISAFMQAHEIAVSAGRRLHYAGARLGTITNRFCSAPYEALIVNPRGELVTCYEVTGPDHLLSRLSTIGRIEDGQVSIDRPARRRLHNLIAERRQGCRDCFCYHSCAGDCYTRTIHDEPGGHLVYGPRCLMNRSITKNILLGQIATGDGLWRNGRQQSRNEVPFAAGEQAAITI